MDEGQSIQQQRQGDGRDRVSWWTVWNSSFSTH